MIKTGVFVNPLKIQSPPAEPVPDAERAAFEATREQELALLDRALPSVVRTASATP